MARILWSSNAPWSSSGYANQTRLTVPRIAGLGHEVALSCFYGLEGGMIEWCGMPCYPTDATRFGALNLGEYARHHGEGDSLNTLVFTLQDVWPLMGPAFEAIRNLRWVCWTPVDHDPAPPRVAHFLEETGATVIAMSRFGQRALEREGLDVPHYIPHAVDRSIFRPQPEIRGEQRRALNMPEDAFVVGMVANNQGLPSRKAFPQVFEAFSAFAKKRSDALLYVHADVFGRNNGVNLIELAQACGIPPERMRTSDQLSLHLGIPQETVAGVFNCFDVLCMPSLGEGFGIPLIEAAACGVPAITTRFTAMEELVGPGWLVEGDRWWDQTQSSFQMVPRVGEIVEALEAAYLHAGRLKERAVSFSEGYDLEVVWRDCWVPVLEAVTAPREVPALRVAA